MRVKRVVAVTVVGAASLIVFGAVLITVIFWLRARSGNEQNFAPEEGQQYISPSGGMVVFSKTSGDSSFLYLKSSSDGTKRRLTAALTGIESEASYSHNGKFIVYSFAESSESKSAVWMVGADGQNPHAITGNDQDALHPVFSPDDSQVFYAASGFTGNHSPVARPARHEWDVFTMPVSPALLAAGVARTKITYESFYELRSLDAAADQITQRGTRILISTMGYLIGDSGELFLARFHKPQGALRAASQASELCYSFGRIRV